MLTIRILPVGALTYVEIAMENGGSMSELVCFEIRLHVSDLNVCLVRLQFAGIHRIRVLYYDYILCTKSLSVKILESREYLRELRQGRLLVHKFFAGEIAESRTVETDPEVRSKDAFAGQLFHTCIRLVKFSKRRSTETYLM